MNNNSRVIHLQIKPTRGAPMQSVSVVEAVAEQGLRDQMASRRGTLFKVIEGGEIKLGDAVRIVA